MFLLLSQGALLGLSCAAQPGPFQAYLVARAARAGTGKSLPLAFVPFLSDPIVIAVVLVVLSQVPGILVQGLHLAGGLLVISLGLATLRDVRRESSSVLAHTELYPASGVLRAALVNLLNPNAWIFWSVVGGPILVSTYRADPSRALAFLIGFYLLLSLGNIALVLLAARVARAGKRVGQILGLLSGMALLFFGAWQLALFFSAARG